MDMNNTAIKSIIDEHIIRTSQHDPSCCQLLFWQQQLLLLLKNI